MNIPRTLYRLLLTLVVVIGILPVSATQTGRLFTGPGFSTDTYFGICRDADGYMWIATDGGLLKFDGNNTYLYRHEEHNPSSLSDSRIRGVITDTKGRVWVSTSNGLNLYDAVTDSFKRIKLPSMDYYGYITDVIEQADGTVTFIVAAQGIFIIDESSGEPEAVQYLWNIPERTELEGLIQAPNGNLYIGSRSGKVYVVSPNGHADQVNVSDVYVTDIIAESDGNILVSSVNDIYRILTGENNRVEHLFSGNGATLEINNFTVGVDGAAYFSTASNGIWKIKPGENKVTQSSDIYLPSMDIRSAKLGAIYADRGGNLWLGCRYKGLAFIPSQQIPFGYHLITDVVPDFKGGIDAFAAFGDRVALGFGNRVLILSPEGEKKLEKTVPSMGTVCAIQPLDNDRLLLGLSNDGIWEMSLSRGTLRKILDQPGKYPSIVMSALPGGDLLIGFHGVGLMRYSPSTGAKKWFEFDPVGGKLNNPFFSSMQITPDSTAVWIGLYGGISRYDIAGDELQYLNQGNFVEGATYALAPMADGTLLAGTSHGLLHCDDKGELIRKYTTLDGLTDNDIRSIIIDNDNRRWIGTKRGLNTMSSDSDKISIFYGGYGLFENVFPYSAKVPDGRIVLGSNLGVTTFTPDSIPSASFMNKPHVTSITINGEQINRGTLIDGHPVISGADNMTLRLPYRDNALTLRLSTLDFRDADNVRYLWHISGYSDEWMSNAPGENVIFLPHLDPGTFELRIKAMDNNVESEETVLTIEISSPWYLSGVAKVIYGIIFIGIIILVFQVLEKRRNEKANEAKIKFFIDVSHDIRSPITLIQTPLESLLKEPFPAAVKNKLLIMYRNSQRILTLVNQLLDLRKIEKGGMRLVCMPTNPETFIRELVEMFKPQAADKKIDLSFICDSTLPEEIWLDRDNFDKILVNIISNAIKYTPDEGSIEVALKAVDDDELGPCAEVSVTDTGIGLGNKTQEQIFERFYRARENYSSGIAGVGIGLDLCRQLTLLHHGRISARNRADGVRGSIFEVRIPLSESAYQESELSKDASPEVVAEKHQRIESLQPAAVSIERQKKKRTAVSHRILVVDDDSELRNFLRLHFESLGHKTLTAGNGSEALKIVSEGNIDLVVSDVKMPGMDGLTMLRLMKSNVDTHHIPVILLSSKNDTSDRIEGWDRGADAYLSKPFNIEELDTLIDNLIGNRLKLKGKFSGAQDTNGKIEPLELKGYNEVLMEKIMRVMNEQIDNPELNVEMLGQSIGISRVQLHRKLKELIGMTPSDFIRNIRLKRACRLLQKPDVEVTQVAYAVGFSSQPHFSTAFKRFTGYSPSEYRQRCLRGDVPPEPENTEYETT